MKQKKTLLVLGTMVALSLAACNSPTDNMSEESQIVESTEVSLVVGEQSVESTEEVTAYENSEGDVSEGDVVKIEGNYIWDLDGISIGFVTEGAPNIPESTIDFFVVDSIYDYKLFTEIRVNDLENCLVMNKDTFPNCVDAINGGDGIFGFVGDEQGLVIDEDEGENFVKITFCYDGIPVNGEYIATWNADGTISVSEGIIEHTSFD